MIGFLYELGRRYGSKHCHEHIMPTIAKIGREAIENVWTGEEDGGIVVRYKMSDNRVVKYAFDRKDETKATRLAEELRSCYRTRRL